MKTNLEWIELSLEADFSEPLFDLPGRSTEVLKALHHAIHPRFPLRSSDMQALGGTMLSDVSVHLAMFERHGAISVTTEKFSGSFRGLVRDEDIEVCNECILLASQGLASAMPENRISAVATRATFGLRLGDGTVDARSYLKEVVKPGVDLNLNGMVNTQVTPCINLEVHDANDGWKAVLHGYDNAVSPSLITVSIWLSYPESLDDRPQEERTGRVIQLRTALLRGLGLEGPTSSNVE